MASDPVLIYKVSISFNSDREDDYNEFVVRMKESDARALHASLTDATDDEKIRHGMVQELGSSVYSLPEFSGYLRNEWHFTLPGYGPKDWKP